MKQILQTLRNGAIEIGDVPCPGPASNQVLVQSRVSLISTGTERMLLEFGKANWFAKARQQPDKVRMVFEKIRADGIAETLHTVKSKLDRSVELGYCNAGVVVGTGVRVASIGPHAQMVSVPKNLCARIPDEVSDDEAAFTIVGAIALQGIRLANPALGETFVVTGLGLIGLLAVQLLRAHGCRVLGMDYDSRKIELARQFGAEVVDLSRNEDPIFAADRFSRHRGVDGVIITAATKSSEPVHQAAVMSRKRGRIVLVGVDAYELIQNHDFHLGVLLDYSNGKTNEKLNAQTIWLRPKVIRAASHGNVAFIGAGGYASKTLIPAFKKAGAGLQVIASRGGLSAAYAGRKSDFSEATTDIESLIEDFRTDTVVIATRHDSHASLVCRALRAGKHVFVEKPLALQTEEIDEIESVWTSLTNKPLLRLGFNRRFSPQVRRMKEFLANTRAPKAFVYIVNAGALPPDHWIADPARGGGRIVGEACHFLDLLRFLAGVPMVGLHRTAMNEETTSISISYADGSIGTVHYLANGNRKLPKERLEVFCDGRVLRLDNFRTLRAFGWPRFHRMNLWRQDKGNQACVAAFLAAIRSGGPSPIPFDEILEVSRFAIQAASH